MQCRGLEEKWEPVVTFTEIGVMWTGGPNVGPSENKIRQGRRSSLVPSDNDSRLGDFECQRQEVDTFEVRAHP